MTAGQNIHIADSRHVPVAAVNRYEHEDGTIDHDLSIYIVDDEGNVIDTQVITFTDDELAHLIFGLADYGAMNGLHIDPPV